MEARLDKANFQQSSPAMKASRIKALPSVVALLLAGYFVVSYIILPGAWRTR